MIEEAAARPGKSAGRVSGGWLVLSACCLAIFWSGSFVFGFPGVMGPHWQAAFGVGRGAVGQTLFFLLAAVGLLMFLVGRWQERYGPARLVAAGGLLLGFNTWLIGRAASMEMVYVWAFLNGAVSAFIYLPALTTVQLWHPRRRGLVSGLFNMAFGISGAAAAPVYSLMLQGLGLSAMTLILAPAGLVSILAAAWFIRPPEGRAASGPPPRSGAGLPGPSLTLAQALRTRSFWLLWATWALMGGAGIAMVTLSVSFGLARGLAPGRAVVILTAFNLMNGLSRVVTGYLSDLVGRNLTMSLAFLAAGLAYLLLPHLDGLAVWAVLAAAVGFALGTLFAVSAPLASDCFGLAHFGSIFGLIYTAYGFVAGPLGPWLSGHLLDRTGGDFLPVFSYLGLFCLASAGLIRLVRPPAPGAGISPVPES